MNPFFLPKHFEEDEKMKKRISIGFAVLLITIAQKDKSLGTKGVRVSSLYADAGKVRRDNRYSVCARSPCLGGYRNIEGLVHSQGRLDALGLAGLDLDIDTAISQPDCL